MRSLREAIGGVSLDGKIELDIILYDRRDGLSNLHGNPTGTSVIERK